MKFETKTRLVLILLIGGFAAVLGKLLYWQIFQQKKIKLLATEQYQHFQKTNTERGKILASDNYPLVMNQNSYLLFADPSRLQISPDQLLTSLEKYLGKNDINKDLLSDKKNFWVPLKENVSEEERGKIQNLGIGIIKFNPFNFSSISIGVDFIDFRILLNIPSSGLKSIARNRN